MKTKEKLLILDKSLITITFVFFGLFRADLVIMMVYLLLVPYIYITNRKSTLLYLALASILSVLWAIFARDQYGYNTEFINIYGVNIFPLFAWAAGLFAMRILFDNLVSFFPKDSEYRKFAKFSIIYFILLVSAEYIAYHHLNIQNVSTSQYEGLPFCDCLHAPRWMQFSYFAMGPFFFILSTLVVKYKRVLLTEFNKYRPKF